MRVSILCLFSLLIYIFNLYAQDESSFVFIDQRVEKALQKSLNYLASAQNENGFFTNGIGNRVGYGYDIHLTGDHVGVTAIAGMAFLANGHIPGTGPYGDVVEKCVKAICQAGGPNGFIVRNNSRMYSHAFATLFLAEVYGMSKNSDVKNVLEKSVHLLVNHQNGDGGWRYSPEAADSDLSIVVCVIQALRAANNAGIYVPKSTIDSSLKYISSLVVKNPKRSLPVLQGDQYPPIAKKGGFHYQNNERITFAIGAAGVTALHGTGMYEGPELEAGIRFLERRYIENLHKKNHAALVILPQVEGYSTNFNGRLTKQRRYLRPKVQGFQYFYGHYYAAQALHQVGGKKWQRWYSKIKDEFLKIQFDDGYWNDEVGPNYATAMATLILSLPKGFLPIFQR